MSIGNGLSGSFTSPFFGTTKTSDAHVLIVLWIKPASNCLLIVLSTHGPNFSGILYGADMHGGPSVGISTGGVFQDSYIVLVLAKMSA